MIGRQLACCSAFVVEFDWWSCSCCRCTGGVATQPLQQQLLQQQLSDHPGQAFASRWIHTSIAAAGEVVVPAMGDSITEGSVAAVLKQPGACMAVTLACDLGNTSANLLDNRHPVQGITHTSSCKGPHSVSMRRSHAWASYSTHAFTPAVVRSRHRLDTAVVRRCHWFQI